MTTPAAAAVAIMNLVLGQSPATQGDVGASESATHAAAHVQTVPPMSIENEVIANIVNQPIGSHTVADLNLPRPFLRRSGDRIIRSSFQDRYRIIVDDTSPSTPMPPDGKEQEQAGASHSGAKQSGGSFWFVGGAIAAGLIVIITAVVIRKSKNRGLK